MRATRPMRLRSRARAVDNVVDLVGDSSSDGGSSSSDDEIEDVSDGNESDESEPAGA